MNYSKRLKKVREILTQFNCEAFLIEDKVNLYYLTGFQVSLGKLIVTMQEVFFLVDNRYYEFCKTANHLTVLQSEKNSLEPLLKDIKNVGFDAESTTYQGFLNLEKLLKGKVFVPLNNPIQKIRSIKDPDELVLMKEAASLGWKGFEHVQSLLKDGIKEVDLATELEIFWKRNGGQGLAFDPIIAFGTNSAIPHYRAGEATLKKGDTVLIDIGVKWKGYHSDMTRTLFWGEPPEEMRQIYNIVAEAKKRALAICRPGTHIGELDKSARDYITEKGYGEHFLHSLGHGVGLEIHEWPLIRNREPYQSLHLEEGMVITIEPGIYLPGIGGVRLEDTIAITSDGYRNLTI